MELKIVSLNLWHGKLFERFAAFLRQQDADILLMQEVYNNPDPKLPKQYRCFEELKKELGYNFATFAPSVWLQYPPQESSIKVLQGDAVFSKLPIHTSDVRYFNEPFDANRSYDVYDPENSKILPRALQHVVLGADSHEINVFNMHGVWDLDGDNYSARRRKMSQTIIDAINGKENVVLAGDSNTKPTNKAMRAIEQHLKSVFGDELTTSFNVKRKDLVNFPGYATAVVDEMYVSPNVKILQHDCPNVDVSDHLPLTATLHFG